MGFEKGNQTFIVTVNVVIFDTPARQSLKSIQSHNARYASERCVVEGEYFENPMTYLSTRATLCNNDDFERLAYTDDQIQKSLFIHGGIKYVESFPLDYMHLVCLGVMKRLLLLLKEGLRLCKLSSRHINQICERLEELKGLFPLEIPRQTRGLHDVKRFKSTEFRMFMHYTGIFALKGILSHRYYKHFLVLSVAMRIILDDNKAHRNKYLDYAKDFLVYFVKKSVTLYGQSFVTYNAHILIHLPDDVNNFQVNFDEIPCFPFENNLHQIKRYVEKAYNPLVQITKQVTEMENASVEEYHKNVVTKTSIQDSDCWFMLQNSNFACAKSVQEKRILCEVYKRNHFQDYFGNPCPSRDVNV